MSRPIAIFCDFDGTITERDMIIMIMEKFGAPGWEQIKDRILQQDISTRSGNEQLFAGIESQKRDEIVRYAQEVAVIRPGFREFLAFCQEHDIQFRVVSGGLACFVEPLLAPFGIRPEQIACNDADFSGEFIREIFPHACDEHCDNDCGMCKPSVMRKYGRPEQWNIVIGDSIPDLQAAKQADFVIARSLLLQKCQELGLPHAEFATFYDCIAVLERFLTHTTEGVLE